MPQGLQGHPQSLKAAQGRSMPIDVSSLSSSPNYTSSQKRALQHSLTSKRQSTQRFNSVTFKPVFSWPMAPQTLQTRQTAGLATLALEQAVRPVAHLPESHVMHMVLIHQLGLPPLPRCTLLQLLSSPSPVHQLVLPPLLGARLRPHSAALPFVNRVVKPGPPQVLLLQ